MAVWIYAVMAIAAGTNAVMEVRPGRTFWFLLMLGCGVAFRYVIGN